MVPAIVAIVAAYSSAEAQSVTVESERVCIAGQGPNATVTDIRHSAGKLFFAVRTSDPERREAFELDLSSGKFARAKAPPPREYVEYKLRLFGLPGGKLSRSGRRLTVCPPDGGCFELPLPPKKLELVDFGMGGGSNRYAAVALDASGSWAVVSYRQATQTWHKRGDTWRPVAVFKIGDENYERGHAEFLGKTVHANMSDCCGSGARLFFYNRRSGRQIEYDASPFNSYGSPAVRVSKRTWAWLGAFEGDLLILHPKDGRMIARTAFSELAPQPEKTHSGEADVFNLHIRLGPGRVAVALGNDRLGHVALVDGRTGKVGERFHLRRCAKAP